MARQKTIVWDEHQEKVFAHLSHPDPQNLIVNARAGSGKTTTIVEALNRLPAHKQAVMLAFNKHIKEDLDSRTGDNVTVLTVHGLGRRIVKQHIPDIELDKDKGFKIAKEVASEFRRAHRKPRRTTRGKAFGFMDPDYVWGQMSWHLKTLTGTTKMVQPSSLSGVEAIVRQLKMTNPYITERQYAEMVQECCRRASEDITTMDFDDMVYFPRKVLAPLGRYGDMFDYVFVDEFQDLSTAERWLVSSCLKGSGGGCVVAIGDPRQACYSWRGAGHDGYQRLLETLSPKVLPLPTTFRCPQSVVDHVKKAVPGLDDFVARKGAKEGLVSRCSYKSLIEPMLGARPGHMILSRYNAPLVPLATAFIERDMPVRIVGREIASSLKSKIRMAQSTSLPELRVEMSQQYDLLLAKAANTENQEMLIEVRDESQLLHSLFDGSHSIEDLKEKIDDYFVAEPDSMALNLSTIHRAKGHEADQVWFLEETVDIGKHKEEENLYYIACTRAKKVLHLVRFNHNGEDADGPFQGSDPKLGSLVYRPRLARS